MPAKRSLDDGEAAAGSAIAIARLEAALQGPPPGDEDPEDAGHESEEAVSSGAGEDESEDADADEDADDEDGEGEEAEGDAEAADGDLEEGGEADEDENMDGDSGDGEDAAVIADGVDGSQLVEQNSSGDIVMIDSAAEIAAAQLNAGTSAATTAPPKGKGKPKKLVPAAPVVQCRSVRELSQAAGLSADAPQEEYEEWVLAQAKRVSKARSLATMLPASESKKFVHHWDHVMLEMAWLSKEFQRYVNVSVGWVLFVMIRGVVC